MTQAEPTPRIAVKDLVRMVGHDLRNNLGVMGNSVYYLTMRVGKEDPKIARHLEILTHEIALTNRTVLDLMDLLYPREPSPALLDLNAVIQGAVERNPPPEEGGATVSLQLAPGNIWLRGDGEQLARAVENILLSRYEAMAAGGALAIVSHAQGGRGVAEFIESGRAYDPEESERWLGLAESNAVEGDLGDPHLGLLVALRLLTLNGGELGITTGPSGCRILAALSLT